MKHQSKNLEAMKMFAAVGRKLEDWIYRNMEECTKNGSKQETVEGPCERAKKKTLKVHKTRRNFSTA